MSRHRLKHIFKNALPIIGGLISQNMMGLIDLMMVAHLGNAAIAAVGISAFAGFLCVAFLVGLSSSVQAISSRREGEGNKSRTAIPLNGGLILSLAIGLPLMVLAYYFVPHVFPLINSDPHQRDALTLASRPLQIIGSFMFLEGIGLIMMNTLLVAGDAHRVFMVNAGLQWLVFLPAAYLVGVNLGFGLLGIWIALMSYRGIQSIIYSLLWHGERWSTIKV